MKVMEYIQEALDVPFGSYFEVHARWKISTQSNDFSHVDLSMGKIIPVVFVNPSRQSFGSLNYDVTFRQVSTSRSGV